MNYQDMEIFLAIVATKSITKAADTLFLSQPTISHRLSSLEEELGIPLMTRNKGRKSIQLTSKGEEFVPIAQRWVSLMKETQSLKETQESLFITLGCTDSLNLALLAPFYEQLLNEEAKLDLHVSTHHSSELYNLLENHEIDIAFVYHNLYYKNVVTKELFREPLYLIQSDPPIIKNAKIHTSELNPDDEIFLTWDNNYQIWHDQSIVRMPRPKISIDTYSLALKLWSDPKRWMIAPASVIEEFCKERPFYISEIENKPPARVCYMVTHKSPSVNASRAMDYFSGKLLQYISKKTFELPTGTYYSPK